MSLILIPGRADGPKGCLGDKAGDIKPSSAGANVNKQQKCISSGISTGDRERGSVSVHAEIHCVNGLDW